MEEKLQSLNIAQKEAVLHTEGPILVLAGAGTGKTRVLTSRIVHIIDSYLASPLQILAVTFTNKAAAEMKHRIAKDVGDQVNNLWIGTFHSIAARIARRHAEIIGLKSDFTIIDQDDQTRLLKQIVGDFNIDTKQFPVKNYLNKISRAKDLGVAIAKDDVLPKLREIFETYQYRLKSMNAADFGDLLLHNLEIFAKSPEALQHYQERFHYILVDEYQDTNNTQYQWLLKLSATRKNLCAVGDDDQSIYSWRGANIANILRFEKDFDNAKVIRLEQNYRSTKNILKAADSVILNNKERHGKTLWTDGLQGEQVKLISCGDDRIEAAMVTDKINEYLRQKKYRLSEIAVLVRAGYQTRAFEESFIRASLPYRIIGGMKFYERMEIKDAICYLRAVANFDDDLALSRIINLPKRGVGETTISNLYAKSKNENISLNRAIQASMSDGELKGKAKDALKLLLTQIEQWRVELANKPLPDVAKLILMESGYIQMWQNENSLEAQGRLENIDEFTNSLADFETITEFLEYVTLVEAKDEKNAAAESVNVMTVHAAKGLEFDLVFIPGLEDGVFPSSRSIEERNGLEEERRLLYVAITRAKKELFLSYAQSRFVFGEYSAALPSRFLQELPCEIKGENNNFFDRNHENFTNFGQNNHKFGGFGAKSTLNSKNHENSKNTEKTIIFSSKDEFFGKRIFHQKFGYGKVIEVDGSKLEIDFEKSGRKTVMKQFVLLQ